MRLPEQLRTTSFRLAVGYTVCFVASVMAILGAAYFISTAEVEGVVRRSVEQDLERFRQIYARDGFARLRREVSERASVAVDDRFYLLTDAEGRYLEGNLPADAWHEGWSDHKLSGRIVAQRQNLVEAAAQNADHEVRLFGTGERLDSHRLLVARNSHLLDETQEILLGALLWGSLVMTILALTGGFVVSIGPTRRVDAIAASMHTIVSGRFDVRLPVTGRRDELDRLSRDINAMLDRIETLMSSLKQVSTDIAHDLRTPLGRLRQRLEQSRRTGRAIDDYENAIEDAIGECDTIIETFNALLRIAQIEAGARKAKFAPVDLSALLLQLFDVYESVAEDHGHAMSADIADGLCVEGDRDLLTQLFANLIENAMTHVPVPARIALSLRREGSRVVADITDDGPGVPPNERRRIFRRLYRLDVSRTTPGSGLGLSLVEAIAELHAASVVALDNAPGLRMRVDFPLAMEMAPADLDGDAVPTRVICLDG